MNEATEPTGTSGAWTPKLMAAHKARIEFMEAMGQSHFSRTDAQWHVNHFAKTVGMELEAENAKLRAEVERLKVEIEASCESREYMGGKLDAANLQNEQYRKALEAYGYGCDECMGDKTWLKCGCATARLALQGGAEKPEQECPQCNGTRSVIIGDATVYCPTCHPELYQKPLTEKPVGESEFPTTQQLKVYREVDKFFGACEAHRMTDCRTCAEKRLEGS